MRITFVAPRYHTNQYEIVRVLQEAGHTVAFHVHTIGSTEDHTLLSPTVFKACLLSRFVMNLLGSGGISKPRFFPNPFEYVLALRYQSPDILVLRGFSLFSLVAAFAGRMVGSKIIFYVQVPPSYGFLKRNVSKMILKLFDAVVYTPLLGSDVIGLCLPPNWHFVPFAVNFNLVEKQKKSEVRILMIGKFYKRKNHLLLLESIAELRNEFELCLTIVGECVNQIQDQVMQEVNQFIAKKALNDCVKIELNVPFSNITQYYSHHDLFVLPATDEPASISVLEAMACGLPAICSDTCGTRGYIQALNAGLIFKSDDKESLKDALRSLLSDPTVQMRMQRSIREHGPKLMSGAAYYHALKRVLYVKWGIVI